MNIVPPPKNGHRYKLVGYVRVSVEEGRTGAHTLSTQEQHIREYADRRYGANCYTVTMFQDNGISGAYGDYATAFEKRTRPGLKAAITEVDKGDCDALIVYDLSRLARSERLTHTLCEDKFLSTKTKFHSTKEEFDLDTEDGQLTMSIISLTNSMQRRSIRRRNKDAALSANQQGYLIGQPCYGWQWETRAGELLGRRRIVPVPEQTQWLIWAKDKILDGWSQARTVRELQKMGVRSPAGNTHWYITVLRNLLRSPVHAGLIDSREGLQKGQHWEHRLYEPEVREQLIERFQASKKFPTNTAKAQQYLLNGLVLCARCGLRLYPTHSHGKQPAFSCLAGLSQGVHRCPKVRVMEAALEEVVLSELKQLAVQPRLQDSLRQEMERALGEEDIQMEAEAAQLENALKGVDTQLSKWAEAYSRGVMAEAEFVAHNSKLVHDRAEQRSRLAAIRASLENLQRREGWLKELGRLVHEFPLIWEHLNLDERKSVLVQLLEKLTIDRNDDGIIVTLKVHLMPERVVVLRPPQRQGRVMTTTGVARLTERQLALLYWIDQGKSRREAADLMQIVFSTVRVVVGHIRKIMGMQSMEEIAMLARGRIQAELSMLPLNGLRGPQFRAPDGSDGRVYVSPKLMQVLPLFANGAQTKEIAGLLGLPVTTVTGRRTLLLETFGAKTMYEAVQKARQQGLL